LDIIGHTLNPAVFRLNSNEIEFVDGLRLEHWICE
jgi:hypothetical protein